MEEKNKYIPLTDEEYEILKTFNPIIQKLFLFGPHKYDKRLFLGSVFDINDDSYWIESTYIERDNYYCFSLRKEQEIIITTDSIQNIKDTICEMMKPTLTSEELFPDERFTYEDIITD